MEVNITDKKENPMLNRTEVKGDLSFKGPTPSNEQLQQSIADKMKVEPALVKVKHIYTAYGEGKAKFEANVYKSKEDIDNLEPLGKKAKEKMAKAAEAAKAKAEAPKEEKKESPKEEAKPEEKPAEAPKEEKKEEPKEEKKEEAPKEEKPKE